MARGMPFNTGLLALFLPHGYDVEDGDSERIYDSEDGGGFKELRDGSGFEGSGMDEDEINYRGPDDDNERTSVRMRQILPLRNSLLVQVQNRLTIFRMGYPRELLLNHRISERRTTRDLVEVVMTKEI
ncbi:hypothetical protein AGABI1DRAFT_132444 [Agaricus bisporus var. burnettii JB137-S8]|uniref:Uncharacterized protein n=1 Tax=Agaricus bisporus var. burnettii (strain JB137-S8 / ATCC MYA-4627 / FGSC 10392) TaxID=597362 RepID=K5VLD6_AGABU|nr:uncharacterized protein AGABI1DRAFT_132444 [Agaricus bisporus var. burnettii JB137-S8]EKM75194.1 hypothetical protein AGABI1DRAFT_132444 [Agaricus bisporus var. burnettii JB137-S8]